MKKIIFTSIVIFSLFSYGAAQSTYLSSNYAASGDTFYLTRVQTATFNFDSTGANINWNFASLTGSSQRRLVYRLPTQTGYSALQWPYIYNSSNVNLSSSDDQSVAVLGFQQSNMNDYFLKNSNYLRQKAAAYTISADGYAVNIKNVYDNPDTLYKFPLQYNGINSSHASYKVDVPNIYYHNARITRADTVKGWGTVTTPYKTYSNALQLVSNIQQIDSVAVANQPVIKNDTTILREITWFDVSEKYPVLFVRQTKTGNSYINTLIEYKDVQQFYQPAALFAYLPVSPKMGDTVTFQNLSANATAYKWNFGDGTDSSTVINPQHVYTNAGNYLVQMIAYNGPLSDTVVIPVKIDPVNQTYIFTGDGNWDNPANWSNSAVPPAVLPPGNTIIINHVAAGSCILNVSQTIQAGASLSVNQGMHLIIQSALRIQ